MFITTEVRLVSSCFEPSQPQRITLGLQKLGRRVYYYRGEVGVFIATEVREACLVLEGLGRRVYYYMLVSPVYYTLQLAMM